MEDIYTIKVRTKPDTRNLYPSERRYSASTVSGLAWVHIALAATSFLLACLALVNPIEGGTIKHLRDSDATLEAVDQQELLRNLSSDAITESTVPNSTVSYNSTDYDDVIKPSLEPKSLKHEYSWILVIAPTMLTIAALAAGIASIMASVKWYIDQNITWLFIMSLLSMTVSLFAFILVLTWLAASTNGVETLSSFYMDKVPFKDFVLVKKSDIIDRNSSHFIVTHNSTVTEEDKIEHVVTKKVLSINVMIAAFLECLWSILSLKIAWKGMRSDYKDGNQEIRGDCVVITTIKGNKNMSKKLTKPDLIAQSTNNKIKRFFLAHNRDGFYLKNDEQKANQPDTECSSEYRERMNNFLNYDGENSEMNTSVYNEALNPIPEAENLEVSVEIQNVPTNGRNSDSRLSTLTWGDSNDKTVYNMNNIDLDKILKSKIDKIKKPDKVETKVESIDDNVASEIDDEQTSGDVNNET